MLMQVFEIPIDDARVGLRLQKGLRATKEITRGTMFAVSARVLSESDYDRLNSNFLDFVQHERYVFAFEGRKAKNGSLPCTFWFAADSMRIIAFWFTADSMRVVAFWFAADSMLVVQVTVSWQI